MDNDRIEIEFLFHLSDLSRSESVVIGQGRYISNGYCSGLQRDSFSQNLYGPDFKPIVNNNSGLNEMSFRQSICTCMGRKSDKTFNRFVDPLSLTLVYIRPK